MFEKIISKHNAEEEAPRAPQPPQPQSVPQLPPKPVAVSAGQRNVLLPDVEIVGEVRFQNDLIVDGRIEGRISSQGSLTIGESAKIKAEILCGSVTVYGKVQGNITANERVELRANAEVMGDIKAGALVMEAGAIYVGSSTIGAPAKRPQSQQTQGKGKGNRPQQAPAASRAPKAVAKAS